MDCRGLGKNGGKFLWVIPLRCSSLVLEELEVTVLFLFIVSLQVLVFSAQLGKTDLFYFQPPAIE